MCSKRGQGSVSGGEPRKEEEERTRRCQAAPCSPSARPLLRGPEREPRRALVPSGTPHPGCPRECHPAPGGPAQLTDLRGEPRTPLAISGPNHGLPRSTAVLRAALPASRGSAGLRKSSALQMVPAVLSVLGSPATLATD